MRSSSRAFSVSFSLFRRSVVTSSSSSSSVSFLPLPLPTSLTQLASTRRFSSQGPGCSTSSASQTTTTHASPFMTVFDRRAKIMQRNRAALRPDSTEYDYLRDEIANRLVERLYDITRTFPIAVDLGSNTGNIAAALEGHGGIKTLHMVEPTDRMLYRDETLWKQRTSTSSSFPLEVVPHHCDIEVGDIASAARITGALSSSSSSPSIVTGGAARLPFADQSVDLVFSSSSLHWVNDIPGVLREVRRILKPDGVFLGAMIGGETLQELRQAFYTAEMKSDGGVSPHVSPMAGVGDVGDLLASAGFGLPSVDVDTFTLQYPSPWHLFTHLRNMGEGNAALGRRPAIMRRRLLKEVEEAYRTEQQAQQAQQQTMNSSDSHQDQGTILATFQVIYMIGWAPAPTQPMPKARGSVPKGFGMRSTSNPAPKKE